MKTERNMTSPKDYDYAPATEPRDTKTDDVSDELKIAVLNKLDRLQKNTER